MNRRADGHVNDFPCGVVAQEFGHQQGVEEMTTAFGTHTAEQRHAEQGEVADDVEDFVADKFVARAQRCLVQHGVGREHDGVVD